MRPGRLRAALLAFVDFVKLGFIGLLAFFSWTITERMQQQRMTVFDLPMSYVYAGVAFGCFVMLIRQIDMSGATRGAAGAGRTTLHIRSQPTKEQGIR